MIQKNWNDIEIFEFCKTNSFTQIFNSGKTCKDVPTYEILPIYSRDDNKLLNIMQWCKDNCTRRYELRQWHLGYGNNVFLKFYSKQDYLAFYSFYDKTAFRKIDVEVR